MATQSAAMGKDIMDLLMILRVLRALGKLRGRDRWSRQQVAAHQADALGRLRAHAYARSPFYRHSHAGLQDRPLHDLPVLTKATLMEHFDEIVTDRAVRLQDLRTHVASGDGRRYLGRYWVCATSGSTGQPALILFDRAEWTTFLASFGRAHEWAGVKMSLTHHMRMAAIASDLPWHMSTQAVGTFNTLGRWMPTLRLPATAPISEIVRRLNDWQPEMLGAYSSMARMLADEQRAGRLRIAPHFVMAGSEVLTDETRRRVEAVWGRVLFEAYGVTEAGGLAAECEQHEGMHLFEDLVIPEVVDEHNRPVPAGEYGGKLLVTVLGSRTLPLIRYEVSDSLRLAGSTGVCGRPYALVAGIQGRAEEMLRFPAVLGGEVAIHPVLLHGLLDTLPASGWQVVQEPDGLRVLLSGVTDRSGDAALSLELAAALAARGARAPRIEIQHVAAIPRTAAGKAPHILAHRVHADAG